MKLVWEQYGARIRRPPQDGLVIVVPGENAVAVRFEETLWAEISANSQQSFGGGPIDRRETEIVRIQANHRQLRYWKRTKKTMLWRKGNEV